ncbi:hypothetical protein Bca4012_037744 [Brassica carinata]
MASSYFEKPQEEEDHIEDEPYVYVEPPPFDIRILTPDQKVELHRLQRMKENWGKPMRSLARMIRLEGTSISTLELQLEEICLPCGENISHDLDSHVLINECLDLICETRKLDELRIEKLVRDHIEVCFYKSYLCTSFDLESEFFILNEPRPLLALADLGDELDVDKLLLEIENPHAENYHENVNNLFYLVDGDKVDYFVKTLFAPVIDFVFPPNAFDSHDHLNFKEHLMIDDTSLVKLFDEKSPKSSPSSLLKVDTSLVQAVVVLEFSFSMASGLHLSPRSSSAAALKLLSRRRLQPHLLGALPRHESTMEAPESPPPS